MSDLTRAAARWGVEPGYHDVSGRWHDASPLALRELTAALSAGRAAPSAVPPARDVVAWQCGERRMWGLAVQLYALRSARNWGHGDFGDLAALIETVAPLGCSAIGLNPLHALFPERAEDASPYSPSSRQFLNPLYIDLNAVDEFPGLAALGLEARGLGAARGGHGAICRRRACQDRGAARVPCAVSRRLRCAPARLRRLSKRAGRGPRAVCRVRSPAPAVRRLRVVGLAPRTGPGLAAARQGADRPIVRRTGRRDRLSYVRAMARRRPVAGMPATGAPPGHAGRALYRSRGRRRPGRRRRLDRAGRDALGRVGRRAARSSTIRPARTGD